MGEVHEIFEQSQTDERDVRLAEDVHVADGAVLHEVQKKGVDFAAHGPSRTLGGGAVEPHAGDKHDLHQVDDVGDGSVPERREIEAVVLDERHAVLVELEDDRGVRPLHQEAADNLADVRQTRGGS